MQKNYNANFKFKVALEAARSDLITAQIISKYQVAEGLIYKWKKQLLDQEDTVFSNNKTVTTIQPRIYINYMQKLVS